MTIKTCARIELDSSVSEAGEYRVHRQRLVVQAEAAPQLIDLTQVVADVVAGSDVRSGSATVFCTHTTAALILNENESLLHLDMAEFLEALASSTAKYRHDDMSIRTENLEPDHGRNAHAHLKQLVLGSSVTLPVVEGRLLLGRWQRLFLLELDRPRERTLLVHVSGI
ncbi:MAG: secondary thiamine-phosphate synthase enzyme YjbQ [Candidatus Xenobia bacterium]